jgi:hypothetical protein
LNRISRREVVGEQEPIFWLLPNFAWVWGGVRARGRCTHSRLRTQGPEMTCSLENASHELLEQNRYRCISQSLNSFSFWHFFLNKEKPQ